MRQARSLPLVVAFAVAMPLTAQEAAGPVEEVVVISEEGINEDILVECRNRLLDSRMCSGLIDHLGFRMNARADFRP